ncbi:MAG: SCO family protein [Methylocystis sp.]|uniref:SCO family protein n=1 Tax=Methylocystis sp. TaxID=1911079 RepID=UPI003D10BBBB
MANGSKGGAKGVKRGGKSAQSASGPSVSKPLLIGVGAVFAAVFAAFVFFTSGKPASTENIGGPFQLTAQTGQPVTDQDFLGRPFLVFFGYTHCPDICHTTLFEMSEILKAMGPDAKVGALFVTVDPERDTPEVLKDYLSNFDPRIIGVTGPRASIDPVLREYRIFSKRAPGKDEDYSVDHTTVVYLMDKNGRFVSPFNVSRRPAEAARELERYL